DLDIAESEKADLLAQVIASGSVAEQQIAIRALSDVQDPGVEPLFARLLSDLENGDLPPEIHLELIEAVDAGGSEPLQSRLASYRARGPEDDVTAQYAEALLGGDAAAGGRIFFRHEAAQCTRCHAIGGRGGDVGPDLQNVGDR